MSIKTYDPIIFADQMNDDKKSPISGAERQKKYRKKQADRKLIMFREYVTADEYSELSNRLREIRE